LKTETVPSLQRAPRMLVATLSMIAAGLFALGILLQGAAGLFLTGCQR
jgi:cell division protein FtsX